MRRAGMSVGPLLTLAAVAVSVVLMGEPALGATRAAAGSCDITQPKSLAGTVATSVEFVSKTAGTVKVYWLDYTGKRVYYATIAPGASHTQATFDTNPWVVLTSSGACIGYVIAPRAQYVIGGTASSGPVPAPATTTAASTHTTAEPHWVYQMINDFNLGISAPSGVLQSSSLEYMECTKGNFGFVDGNSQFMATAVRNEFEAYSKLIPGWVTQIGKLKASASTRLAKARLLAAEPLHAKEVNAWEAATAAIKEHSCGAVLGDLEAAQKVGVPDWADQYAAVNAIALLYGSHSASHQFPYAQKLG